MDTLFFLSSKILWALVSPDSLLLILLVASWLLLALGLSRWGRHLLTITCAAALLVAFLPLGEWLFYPLERRFTTNPELPSRIDGIIVLGGAVSPQRSSAWQQIQYDDAAERMSAFAALARRYPDAELVFTGGNGSLTGQAFKEADSVPGFMQDMGLGDRELVIEAESRNTWENVVLSKALVLPDTQERWLLITSAFHMPRATGIFCEQNWPVIPWPVDHRSNPDNLLRVELQFAAHLRELSMATREWLGLLAYYFTGRSTRLLPGEATHCGGTDTPRS
ncbi:MAG: YdcF family protein [Gammaproteobacteria bacterium]|nr:YdcF family protein [Gammaproteobacteria bacterium]MDP2348609.1 YdcF family protein [Gammaproteobacteria bacterium]